MKKCGSILRKQNGGSAVEFAIVLPFFLLIVFGIVEWSLYLFNDHIITNASRTGARRGIIQASPRISVSEIQQAVQDYSEKNLVTFGAANAASTVVPAICTAFGDNLSVKVSYNYTFLLLPALTAGQVPLSKTIVAETVMKCE